MLHQMKLLVLILWQTEQETRVLNILSNFISMSLKSCVKILTMPVIPSFTFNYGISKIFQ